MLCLFFSLILTLTRKNHLQLATVVALAGVFVSRDADAQPCPSEDYAFETQAQVDAFPEGCVEVLGDLWIGPSSDITNLTPLRFLNSVRASLIISDNAALTRLSGLSGLTSVGGNLSIHDNAALNDLDGLSHLTFVGSSLHIYSNTALPDLDGFSSLSSLGWDVFIHDNTSLTNLDGLAGINAVEREFYVYNNAVLTNLDGLSGVTSVGEDFWIYENAALTNLDGLSALTVVGWDIVIWNNATLANVDGLSSLTSVGGDLGIAQNAALTNLDGLSGLASVGEDLIISGNVALGACSCGLHDCVSGGGVMGAIEMNDNAVWGDCNNDGADLVAGQCSAVGIQDEQELGIPTVFTLHAAYPNPFNPTTTISYALPVAADASLSVYDALGRQIRVLTSVTQPAGTYEVSFDATGLPSGVYFYRLQADDYVETKRMLVVR